MSLKYPKGSLTVLNSRTRVNDLKDNDIIGVRFDDSFVFHRVADIDTQNETAVLYGDLQGKDMSLEVKLNDSVLLGKEVMTIPVIGNIASVFMGRGVLVAVIGLVLIVLCLILWERFARNKERVRT